MTNLHDIRPRENARTQWPSGLTWFPASEAGTLTFDASSFGDSFFIRETVQGTFDPDPRVQMGTVVVLSPYAGDHSEEVAAYLLRLQGQYPSARDWSVARLPVDLSDPLSENPRYRFDWTVVRSERDGPRPR